MLQQLPPELSIEQQFRLIEIAHETSDLKVKELALELLTSSRPDKYIRDDVDKDKEHG